MQTTLTGKKAGSKTVAEHLAKKQREISVAEFFTKNRHLLGFDNPRKALLTTIKEAVDNSLDATQEMGVLPEIRVEVKQLSDERFKVTVEDNGPGIVKAQVPRIFAKLLYGSKFHKMSQSRGQQGVGISAAAMYGQLTTGKGIKIWSRIGPKKPAHYFELHINTKLNEPEILKEEVVEWDKKQGTKIEIELEAKYQKGKQSIDEYLKQTAIANPHAAIFYKPPDGEMVELPRASKELPMEPKEIRPHPYGVELGIMMKMLSDTRHPTLQSFLQKEFSRVSPRIAKQICEKARLYERARPSRIARQEVDNLFNAIKHTKIMAPPTNCLVPIGKDHLIKGMKKEVDAEFYAAVTRSPSVYRGNPFQVEVGIAYGGTLSGDDFVKIIRYANRVPLLYQQSACAITKSIIQTAWRHYGLSQSRNAIPAGPAMIVVHIASVWVPFTSESKEAIASYPEIIKEIKLALQECGRQVGGYVRKLKKIEHQQNRQKIFELYIDEVASSLSNMVKCDKQKLLKNLHKVSKKRTVGVEK